MAGEHRYDTPDVQQLVHAFAILRSDEEVRSFLSDLCTPREVEDFAQRLQVARYLDEGESYISVQQRTGASSTTVSRVSKALNGSAGGYRQMLIRLEDGE